MGLTSLFKQLFTSEDEIRDRKLKRVYRKKITGELEFLNY